MNRVVKELTEEEIGRLLKGTGNVLGGESAVDDVLKASENYLNEVVEDGTVRSFADLISSEDAQRYLQFLENGSVEGLSADELLMIQKIDDYFALNR